MKNPFIIPTTAALLGFAVAWVAKPTPSAPPAAVSTAAAPQEAPKKSNRPSSENRASGVVGKRPKEVHAGDFPLADAAEKGPKSREEAKMLRLSEALGLTVAQQAEIIKLVEDSRANISSAPVIEDLATRGKALEEALRSLLSPEQFEKFQEIRVRERENQIESRAQKALTQVIEEIDLSPEQREEVMDRLRQSAKAELQSIPAAATLLVEKSVLPTGKNELSVDGVLLLAKTGETALSENPVEARQRVLDVQRAELEEKLRNYDGILTPAQMGQFHAALAEQKAAMTRIPMAPPGQIEPRTRLDPSPDPEPESIEPDQ